MLLRHITTLHSSVVYAIINNHKSSDYFITPGAQLADHFQGAYGSRLFFFLIPRCTFYLTISSSSARSPTKRVVIKHPGATALVAWPSSVISGPRKPVTVWPLWSSVKLILEINLLWLATRGNLLSGGAWASANQDEGLDRGIDYALALGVSRSKERWVLYENLYLSILYHISRLALAISASVCSGSGASARSAQSGLPKAGLTAWGVVQAVNIP